MDDELREPSNDGPQDFLEELLRGFIGADGAAEAARAMREQGFRLPPLGGVGSAGAMGQAMSQFRFLMNSSDGPVNWRAAEDIGRQAAYQSGDPRLSAAQAQRARQALSIADLWLDPVTDLAAPGGQKDAWTRVQWVDRTLPAWKRILNPIALNVSRAMTDALQEQMGDGHGLPEGLGSLASGISKIIPRMSAMSFGAQVGQALGAMAKDGFGSSDTGFPLVDPGLAALVPANLAAFAEGLDLDYAAIEQYLAVREAAHARLFAAIPWLRHDLELALIRYAEEIEVDTEAIADAARSIDPSNPNSVNEALAAGVFTSEISESQAKALERLETLLSLVEGWVETVTTEAVAPYLPEADRLRELVRRRRVTGSSAEALLGQLVGLKLRPRQARGAAALFRHLQEQAGPEARDAVWAHPDHVPTAADLENPSQFGVDRAAEAPADPELDDELRRLLDGTLGWHEGVPEQKRNAERGDPPEPGEPEPGPS